MDLVLDTADSVERNTNRGTVRVVFAVDGGHSRFADNLINAVGPERVYASRIAWGWGAGLWSLLLESISSFDERESFSHFQSIDYDTLYLGPGADRKLLDLIVNESIGLLGVHSQKNEHWASVYQKQKQMLGRTFGAASKSYIPGEGVQGGYMTITRSMILRLHELDMFRPPFSVAKHYTHMADDHLIALFARMCGMSIVDVSSFARCTWTAQKDPRGIEKDGVVVFHPTKLNPRNKGRSADVMIRNHYRQLRGTPGRLV